MYGHIMQLFTTAVGFLEHLCLALALFLGSCIAEDHMQKETRLGLQTRLLLLRLTLVLMALLPLSNLFWSPGEQLDLSFPQMGLAVVALAVFISLLKGKIARAEKRDVVTATSEMGQKPYSPNELAPHPSTVKSCLPRPVATAKLPVLIAEGSQQTRDLLQSYLRGTDYQPVFALTGIQTLERYKANEYKIVLIGADLPEIDGATVMAMIREWEVANGRARTRIITLGPDAAPSKVVKIDFGASHLSEPLSSSKLISALDRCRLEYESGAISASAAMLALPDDVRGLLPAYIEDRISEIEQLKWQAAQSNAFAVREIACELSQSGTAFNLPTVVQVGRALTGSASVANWPQVNKLINDLEHHLQTVKARLQREPGLVLPEKLEAERLVRY